MPNKVKQYVEQFNMQAMMEEKHLSLLQWKHFHKGEYLMKSDTILTEILCIITGKAKTLYVTHNGSNTLHSFLLPFTIIGDVEFFSLQRVVNDVIAICDMDCLALSMKHYEELKQDSMFVYTLASQISQKLIRSNHNKSISLTYPVENRLAAYICASSSTQYFKENHQDASEMIGCSYRQLQRVLQKFVKEGYLVCEKKGCYRILNQDKLRTLGKDIYIF